MMPSWGGFARVLCVVRRAIGRLRVATMEAGGGSRVVHVFSRDAVRSEMAILTVEHAGKRARPQPAPRLKSQVNRC